MFIETFLLIGLYYIIILVADYVVFEARF